jgi:hypothetical protein
MMALGHRWFGSLVAGGSKEKGIEAILYCMHDTILARIDCGTPGPAKTSSRPNLRLEPVVFGGPKA